MANSEKPVLVNSTIAGIKMYPAKGEAGKELAEARLIENLGLEGDFHAKGGERQISLLFMEDRERLEDQPEQGSEGAGLCFLRFKENITIRRGAAAEYGTSFEKGTRLEAGEALLEITGETKHCHEECVLFHAGKPCLLAGKSLFAKVLESGAIRVGDRISVCL